MCTVNNSLHLVEQRNRSRAVTVLARILSAETQELERDPDCLWRWQAAQESCETLLAAINETRAAEQLERLTQIEMEFGGLRK